MRKIKNCILLVTILLGTRVFSQQTHVNRESEDSFGQPVFNPILNQFGVQYSRSIECANGDRLTVAHTFVSGQGENIFLERRTSSGVQTWSVDVNTSGSDNDYGIAVYEDPNTGDIYVCGTTDQGGPPASYKAVVIIFDASGNLTTSVTIGNSGQNYIATALTIHPASGNLLVGMSAEGASTSYDYRLEELNPGSLSGINSNTYDKNNLIEVLLGIEIDTGTGDIILLGASQNSSGTWSYAAAVFDGSSLNYISDTRTNLGGFDDDQPLDFAKDASNNIYLTGKTWNGTDFDIKTIKLAAPSFSIAWTATIDVHGMDDVAGTVDVDPVTGAVIIGGFATRANGVKEMLLIKYNGNTGVQIWQQNRESKNPAGDAVIKKVSLNQTNGKIYFTGGETDANGVKQVIAGRIKSVNGSFIWSRNVSNGTNDVLPSDIEATSNGCCIISVLDSTIDSYLITEYSEFESDTSRAYKSNGEPCWMARELIVDFMPEAIDTLAINDQIGTKIMQYGNLSDFLTTGATNSVNNAFEEICRDCDIKATKIYPNSKTQEQTVISRLGEEISVPIFWTTLLLEFPNTITIQQAYTVLKTLPNVVVYAHPNYFLKPDSPPNDSLYLYQSSLHAAGTGTNANINVEEAWSIAGGGKPWIRCGVYDSGIHWKHEEFGYDGVNQASSKVDGLYFDGFGAPGHAQPLKSYPFPDSTGHGTASAAIIGAIRNNNKGIAGIAGGDATLGNNGVKLYGMRILGHQPRISDVLESLRQMALGSDFNNVGFGVDLLNHSWRTNPDNWPDSQHVALSEQIRFVTRAQITNIASRGNDGGKFVQYPACVDSTWIISVGGTGSNGQYKGYGQDENNWAASYGIGIDVAAPSVLSLVYTCGSVIKYGQHYGTSAAAPHVSGIVALLMSYMNDSLPKYKNLAPEDCEYIISRSAKGYPVYDSLVGYGLVDAGKALRLVEKPYQHLYHYGTNSITPHSKTVTQIGSHDTITLTYPYQNYEYPARKKFTPGLYEINTFRVDAIVNHNLTFVTDSLVGYWPRHSSSFVYPLPNSDKELDMHERVEIVSLNAGSAVLRGYVYEVWDMNGFHYWWPCDTSFASLNLKGKIMEYSMLAKNKAVGITENDKLSSKVSLFPNPADRTHTLVVKHDKVAGCVIDLFDISGRWIKTVYDGKTANGEITITENIEKLPSSLYIYVIKIEDKILNKKFVKD